MADRGDRGDGYGIVFPAGGFVDSAHGIEFNDTCKYSSK
jgi:hypothetical protein